MWRTLGFRRAAFRFCGEGVESPFQTVDQLRQSPLFLLNGERHLVQLLEVVLEVSDRSFDGRQSRG